jgi:hypothetical protein
VATDLKSAAPRTKSRILPPDRGRRTYELAPRFKPAAPRPHVATSPIETIHAAVEIWIHVSLQRWRIELLTKENSPRVALRSTPPGLLPADPRGPRLNLSQNQTWSVEGLDSNNENMVRVWFGRGAAVEIRIKGKIGFGFSRDQARVTMNEGKEEVGFAGLFGPCARSVKQGSRTKPERRTTKGQSRSGRIGNTFVLFK